MFVLFQLPVQQMADGQPASDFTHSVQLQAFIQRITMYAPRFYSKKLQDNRKQMGVNRHSLNVFHLYGVSKYKRSTRIVFEKVGCYKNVKIGYFCFLWRYKCGQIVKKNSFYILLHPLLLVIILVIS